MAELKPCPFCGKKESVIVFKENDEYIVCCDWSQDGCGATGGYSDSIKSAIEKWNRRAENDT